MLTLPDRGSSGGWRSGDRLGRSTSGSRWPPRSSSRRASCLDRVELAYETWGTTRPATAGNAVLVEHALTA